MTSNPEPPLAIAIMAKAPIAGLAKTRLMPMLGADGAADLQAWLLQRTVATALAADLGPVSLWCTPDTSHPAFIDCGRDGRLSLQPQPEGDLGQRMRVAAQASATAAGVLLIGTDCPLLDVRRLRRAAAGLRQHDAVLLPAEDGGYVLLGLRRVAADVFRDINWSTERVLAQTRDRLNALDWRWEEPETLWDIDHPADYIRLQTMLAEDKG
jgi:rSAM/selenodomain-associated transferase 1